MRMFGRVTAATPVIATTAATLLSVVFLTAPAQAAGPAAAPRPVGDRVVSSGSRMPVQAHLSSGANRRLPVRVTQHPTRRVCSAAVKAGWATCLSLVRTDVKGHKGLFAADTAPAGYGPSDLQSAYALPSLTAGAGQTVAVVDAYDDPNAEADLQVYRDQYGLPACTTANGCFSKVAENGTTDYPVADAGWAEEESLDVDMVSAICPNCHILLVEANSNSIADLGASVDEAVALGAEYVSNSYGSAEESSETADDPYYDHPGVAVTASSGDSGYGVQYPAASQYVTAVGGTTLTQDSDAARGWTESAWSGGGSGCSAYEPKPAWQTDTGCANRTVADVSAVADPNTGVAVYDSYDEPGWAVFGGTSVASPIIASTFALAGTPAAGTYPSSYPYADPSALNDVTTGSNGSCTPSYLCTAGPGYDGPTGLGTPNGVLAFSTGPHGVVSGTVTDASTGKPISGAEVDIGDLDTLTGSAGSYDLGVPVGSYTVTVTAYGYVPQTVTGVQVTSGETTTESFALAQAPSVTLTGQVTDGSGQGWPVYAEVSVPGTPASTYTDPATGDYTLTLPGSNTYNLTVDAVYQGYQQAQQSLQVGTSSMTQDFSLQVDPQTCSAPGYALSSSCAPVPGGLVEGTVTDANTGDGADNATVASVASPSVTATTAPTGDPSIPDGFYYMFVPDTGSQQFTAAKLNYVTATSTATVTANAVTAVNFTLDAGQLSVTPASISQTVKMGTSATEDLNLTNTGTAPATVQLLPQSGGFSLLGPDAEARAVPLQRVKGRYSPLSVAASKAAGEPAVARGTTAVAQPDQSSWVPIATYTGGITDNGVATDTSTGLVYSAGGVDDFGNVDNTLEVYNPGTQEWAALPDMQYARDAPAVAFIDGLLYVTGGWDANGNTIPQTEIYDPSSETWSAGANIPNPYAASAVAVLNGEMYVIGGCDAVQCGYADVQVYDPESNSWSTAASYPQGVGWLACGTISGEIYCAGGSASETDTANAYVYDPSTNSWSPIAPLPIDLWGMGYTAANGELLVSGGVTNGFSTLTNQGFAYDPATNSWTDLPNNNQAVYRGGSACGFYLVGGLDSQEIALGISEQLPGYSQCGFTDVPWLSESEDTVTLNPGAEATVTVTLNAGDPSVSQPGTYTASLSFSDDTPYQTSPVDVTMDATPPSTWGEITGTVSGQECDGTTVPLAAATVQVDGAVSDYTLSTDDNGQYSLWLDKDNNPLTLIVALNGWQPQTIKVKVVKGETILTNFTLLPDPGTC